MEIYKITNILDGKLYIGQTIHNTKRRWREHCRDYKKLDYCIYRAMRLHGIDNFTVDMIDNSAKTMDELNALEEMYIAKFNTLAPNGYNLLPGGKNHKLLPESKAKIGAANKGKFPSNETRAKLCAARVGKSSPNKGKKASLESRTRMSIAKSGERNGMFGKRHTVESNAKNSASNKGKPGPNKGKSPTLEVRKKISLTLTGRKATPETRTKLSKIKKGRPVPWKCKKVQIIETGQIFESASATARFLGIPKCSVMAAIKRRSRNQKTGFTFKYI